VQSVSIERLPEDGADIPIAAQNPNDLDAGLGGSIDHEVRAHHPEPDPRLACDLSPETSSKER
jgi:hypothetical protein